MIVGRPDRVKGIVAGREDHDAVVLGLLQQSLAPWPRDPAAIGVKVFVPIALDKSPLVFEGHVVSVERHLL